MNTSTQTIHFETLSQLHQAIGIEKPKHPLFSIIRFEDFPPIQLEHRLKLITEFYQITLKKECPCKIQYGQTMFDFDEGIISCFAPRQVSVIDKDFSFARAGWQISIHPDYLRSYPLGQKMKQFGFFDYAVNEALILSEQEQQAIEIILQQIEREYHLPIDRFSQDVIVANLDVLLSCFNRYYNRQFETRKLNNHQILATVDNLLNTWWRNNNKGLPAASFLAAELNLSPKYLSDCIKQLTGQTTQQLIHEKLIEQAKDLLATTTLSVSEIAYQLGFEYPQSFNKLFKNRTSQTPVAFRRSFN